MSTYDLDREENECPLEAGLSKALKRAVVIDNYEGIIYLLDAETLEELASTPDLPLSSKECLFENLARAVVGAST